MKEGIIDIVFYVELWNENGGKSELCFHFIREVFLPSG